MHMYVYIYMHNITAIPPILFMSSIYNASTPTRGSKSNGFSHLLKLFEGDEAISFPLAIPGRFP